MADNNQNKAEQYRQERKARLAKAAKKNAKNIEKKTAIRSAVKKIVAIVIAVAIALGCLAGILNYVGVIQKLTPIGQCGEERISHQEYLYYYFKTYNQVYSNATQSASQGSSFYGYDTSLTPDKQEPTAPGKDGSKISWVEYLHNETINTAQTYLTLYQEAKKAGLELDEAELAAIDANIEEMRTQANDAGKSSADDNSKGYSLNAYLRRLYGNGISESFLKKQLKIESLVQKFYNTKLEEFEKACTVEEVNEKFNKTPDAYQFVDFRLFQIDDQTYTAAKDEKIDLKAKADTFFKGITDEKSFLTLAKENMASKKDYNADTSTRAYSVSKDQITNTNEDLAKWLFDNSTKANDKKLIEEKNGETTKYYIALMIKPKHDVNTVTVRHILLSTIDLQTRQPLPDAKIKEAKDKANQLLAEWKSGDKTEDSFAKLATNNTEDEGSKANGGLYNNVLPGQMVPEFDKYIFDANRKAGDYEIVETEFGYHIIYFVKNDGVYKDTAIRSELGSEDLQAFVSDLLASDEYVIGLGPRRTEYVEKKISKKIASLVAEQKRNANSQQSLVG